MQSSSVCYFSLLFIEKNSCFITVDPVCVVIVVKRFFNQNGVMKFTLFAWYFPICSVACSNTMKRNAIKK